MSLVTWPTPGIHQAASRYRVTPTFVPGMIWWWRSVLSLEDRDPVWLEVTL